MHYLGVPMTKKGEFLVGTYKLKALFLLLLSPVKAVPMSYCQQVGDSKMYAVIYTI